MSKRKNHHYVPRFYLKRFSHSNEGLLIGLYNLKNKIFIKKAPVKHQASSDYLYGKDDEVESELSKLESNISKLFYYWTEEKLLIPPPENSNGLTILKRFILYQIFRTPKAGEDVNKSSDKALKILSKNIFPEMWEEIKDSKLQHSEPALLALLNCVDKEHTLDFLSCKFLVNLSDLPFITSDAPVVLYNQLMENCDNYVGATGLTSKGLQIFYPIHPRLMICLFDSNEYDYGTTDCISTKLVEDSHQLNALQFINCNSQLFFNEYIEKDYLDLMIREYQPEKNGRKIINEFITTSDGRKFLYSSFEDSKIKLHLSFCTAKIQKKYRGFIPRHESLNI